MGSPSLKLRINCGPVGFVPRMDIGVAGQVRRWQDAFLEVSPNSLDRTG